MLSSPTTIEQIDAWRTVKSENEHLEFKEAKSQFDFDRLLKYCVALANERGGKLLLGIENKPPRLVVGTTAYPNQAKTTNDLFIKLGFRVDIEEVLHPNGRVLIFHIPPRPIGHAYDLDGSYWMRSGESLVAMTMDQLKQIAAEDKSNKASLNRKILALAVVVVVSIVIVLIIRRTRQPNGTKETLSPSVNVTAVVGRSWRNKQNWRDYLQVGMTKAEVVQLFGVAERVNVMENLEEWGYGSGQITFKDGKIYSWFEPASEPAKTEPSIDSKSHGDAKKMKSSPPIEIQAPYGNLAKRCQGLGTGILLFIGQRNQIKPDFKTHSQDYWSWYRTNDGQFRFWFYDDAKALQKDLAAVNIRDRRLDELIARHEQYFVERNRVSPQTVVDHSMMYHLSLDNIEEIGDRFKFLATQIPGQ